MGSKLPCNEEWFYTPRDACYKIPVHVQLDWRVSVPAGMEYISRIYITLLGPEDVKEKLVPTLIELKESGNISPSVIIGDECPAEANCLKYV